MTRRATARDEFGYPRILRKSPNFFGLFRGAVPAAACAALLAGCAAISPFEAGLQEEGALYRPAFGGVEEALPVSRERRAGDYVLSLEMDPQNPSPADEVRLAFVLKDRSRTPARPVTGAKLACTARMPKVPGHIHNLGIHKKHTELRPGRYVMMPVVFGMGGRWDVVVQAQLQNGRQFYAVFPLRIAEPPR